jgi:prepilin-type N-terminal cleavage/methylation domain-containing protein
MNTIMRALRNRGRSRASFTLIELLVVIVIIVILMAILLRVTVYVNARLGKGRVLRDIEQIKNALAEYHSTFGIYPPVSWVRYEFEKTTPRESIYDSTGLTYYLCMGPQNDRWQHFLDGVMPDMGEAVYSGRVGGAGTYFFYTNNVWSCYDPWDREYQYQCYDPYQSYRVWSYGPDGTNGTPDDIGIEWTQ